MSNYNSSSPVQKVFEEVMQVIERNSPPTYTEFQNKQITSNNPIANQSNTPTQRVSSYSNLICNNYIVNRPITSAIRMLHHVNMPCDTSIANQLIASTVRMLPHVNMLCNNPITNQPSAPTLRILSYTSLGQMSAGIVDQFIIEDIRKAPPTSPTYHSPNQKNNVIIATAKTISGRIFTVQRLMIGQLNKNFSAMIGLHSLGKLLSFISGDNVLIFGYPTGSSRHKDGLSTMMGIWIAIEGYGVRPINFQRMRVLFSENCILYAIDQSEQFLIETEIARRRLFNSQEIPNSPLFFEPARSSPDCAGCLKPQPVILYSPTFVHPNLL